MRAKVGLPLLAAGAMVAASAPRARADDTQYARCRDLYRIEDYSAAVTACKKAYLETTNPDVLYTIAQSYRFAHQPVEALRYYDQFLDAKGPTYPPEKRAIVQQAIDAAKRDLAAQGSPASGPAPATAVTAPPAPAPASTPSLAPALAPAPAPSPATAVTTSGPPPGEKGQALLWGGAAAAAAGAGLALGGYLYGRSAPGAPTLGDFLGRETTARWLEGIGAGIGVIGAATFTFAWVTRGPRERPAAISLVPSPGGAAIVYTTGL